MTNEAKLFNARYNLKVSDSSFRTIDEIDIISQDLTGKPKKNFLEILKRFFTNPTYVIALIFFLSIIFLSLVLPLLTNYGANTRIEGPNGYTRNLPSTSHPIVSRIITNSAELTSLEKYADQIGLIKIQHPTFLEVKYDAWEFVRVNGYETHKSVLGTDAEGYDFWARLWTGTASSFKLSLIVVALTTVIGTTIGSYIGLFVGSFIDIIFMKVLALYNSIPQIVWYSVILYILQPGFTALVVVFVLTGWQSSLSTARVFMWRYVNSEFMKAAETVGASKLGRIFKHALPHYMGYIAYNMVSHIPGVIAGEAGLAFLGLSPNPTNASLGNVLNESRNSILAVGDNPWVLLLPTILIFVITLSLHFVAMGVNDALEPKYGKK